ncbi:MAG: carboxypeptidase regulatory-like domain-containing protein [Dehalococcoidia bacterium]|nr:carboxypeptidase regulatory-like domain-containing protein [Dehalococcoidia bacterium]
MALNRTEAASLLVLAASVVFLVACGAGDETVEERWAALGVPEPEIVFLGDFTDEERAAIVREVKSVQVSFAERFDVVTSEFTLYVSTEFEALNEAFREWLEPEYRRRGVELSSWFRCSGLAWPEAVFIALETCDEETRAYGGPIAHEYFHILQHDLGVIGGSGGWPYWLLEGAAEYASAHYHEEQGRSTVSHRREVARMKWAALGVCFPGLGLCNRGRAIQAPDLTGQGDLVLQYQVGFLAVDWLVDRKGEEALIEFFRQGGGQHEFEEAFGMTPEEFADGFGEYWQEVASPFEWEITGNVLDPDGRPVAYAQIHIVAEVEHERIVVMGDRANSRGEFRAYGPDERHTLGIFLKCPDGSRAYWAFLGEWGQGGFVADADGRFEPDDEGAEPVAGGRNRAGILIELPDSKTALLERHCQP